VVVWLGRLGGKGVSERREKKDGPARAFAVQHLLTSRPINVRLRRVVVAVAHAQDGAQEGAGGRLRRVVRDGHGTGALEAAATRTTTTASTCQRRRCAALEQHVPAAQAVQHALDDRRDAVDLPGTIRAKGRERRRGRQRREWVGGGSNRRRSGRRNGRAARETHRGRTPATRSELLLLLQLLLA